MSISRARLLVAGFSLAVLAACGQPQIPPAQNYGTISGRAFDPVTNLPLAGVVVTVDTILSATTGSDGSYKIVNIPLGTYTLRPQAPRGYAAGYQPQYDGSIIAGQTVAIDIPVTKQ